VVVPPRTFRDAIGYFRETRHLPELHQPRELHSRYTLAKLSKMAGWPRVENIQYFAIGFNWFWSTVPTTRADLTATHYRSSFCTYIIPNCASCYATNSVEKSLSWLMLASSAQTDRAPSLNVRRSNHWRIAVYSDGASLRIRSRTSPVAIQFLRDHRYGIIRYKH